MVFRSSTAAGRMAAEIHPFGNVDLGSDIRNKICNLKKKTKSKLEVTNNA